jgi:OmcA/MtrC family decaheme c-type cytochrome
MSFRWGLGLIVLCSSALLRSSDAPVFTKRDLAYFADPAVVSFVRPGLVIKLTGATVAADGTMTVQFTITDPQGVPLDRTGRTTPGPVSTTWVASYIPKGQTDYISLIARPATGAVSGTVNQPATDTGGSYTQTGDGQYTYRYGAKAPAGFDASQTVSFGVWASRDLTTFQLGTNTVNAVLSFVPAGGAPVDVHDVIHTVTCNKCHDPLGAHGGVRREVALCVLCHNPGGNNGSLNVGTVDPDTGNSIDFKVLIHKIHMGSSLPSVQAGHPFQLIGFNNAVNDFSTVVFPADPRNCQMCHEHGASPQGGTWPPGAQSADTTPPVQGDWWLTHPSRAACGSCHDNVNFATGENHANLPQVSDNLCTSCHFPQGDLPFDVSIVGAHTIPTFAPGLPGVVFAITGVTNRSAGQSPTVAFTVKDKGGNPTNLSDLATLNLTVAGPTADYATEFAESALKATGSGGSYAYTFQGKIPANATGTWTVGIEGYRNVTLLPNTTTQMTVRDAGDNQVSNFSVDGSPVTPHPVEVVKDNCNGCHYSLSAHGGIRNQTQYCILCHNPNATDQAQRPASANPPQSINFPVLIHRIHTGDSAPAGGQLTPFVVYGFNGGKNDFSDVRFPGDLRNCEKCHVNDSQDLPLPSTRLPVQNPQAFYSPMGPASAACTACHLTKSTAAHTQLMTSPTLGESCDVCHGTGASFSVDQVHARTL